MINVFAKAAKREVKSKHGLGEMREEVQLLSKHCAQGVYSLEFVRCQSPTCSHCPTARPEASRKTLSLLRKSGGYLFFPVWSQTHGGHYATFLEQLGHLNRSGATMPLDSGLPSGDNIGHCKEPGCHKTFQSNADRKRHMFIVHDD